MNQDLFLTMDSAIPILPPDERERLEALRRYGAFGLLRAAVFDDISRLAAFICRTPISLITLIDTNRQWFLSQSGIEACETSREASFCAHALVGTEMLIVEDANGSHTVASRAGEPHDEAEESELDMTKLLDFLTTYLEEKMP